MAKQLKMNLQFTADNKKAIQSIQEVQSALSKLTTPSVLSGGLAINRDLQQAVRGATELQAILNSSLNMDTGNLDLSKFNQELKASGKELSYYRDQLYQLGPQGEQAFVQLTNAITLAEMPLKKTSKLLDGLWNTMKNTMRWQLTSSVLHGFMGALQTAYGYSQDLNESLNNIRIVTSSSVEKMSEFAKEANKAAKELNTTTLDYTDAALIYYQQGLSENDVKSRTDVTVKLANVSRQSAEEVSNQLTAIWNNFYDGSKSLEHYANVLTALGAATASSTEEIAGGLEKFAAVATTIGLSYEYAAAALATITSNTRESEEVVGTALKTIFARIQGLNLGETLDDGTTLNKYSEALNKVGISILDTQGNLKTMDVLLDEMGEKWNDLSKAQQTALAQTVAGTRQYNQLIALMTNWNSGDSDSFQANLNTAQSSSGALQEQANIYAESWEAARDRVRASAEAVYASILDDEFFIELTDRFAELLDGVKLFIDSLGGIKGVLLTIGSIVTNVFSKQIGQSLSNAAYNIRMALPGGKDAERKAKEQANELLIGGAKDAGTLGSGYRAGAYEAIAKNQLTYITNAKYMSETEMKVNQLLMDRNKLLQEEVVKQSEKLNQIKAAEAISRKDVQRKATTAGKSLSTSVHGNEKAARNIGKHQAAYEKEIYAETTATALANKTIEISVTSGETIDAVRQHISGIVTELAGLDAVMEDDTAEKTLQENYKKLAKTFSITENEAKELWNVLQSGEDIDDIANKFDNIAKAAGVNATNKLNSLRDALRNCTGSTELADSLLEDYLISVRELGPESVEAADKLARLNQMVDQHNTQMSEAAIKPIAFGEAISKATSAIMAMGQASSTVKGIIDVFNDENASTGDKIMSIVTGVGMLIPAIMALAPAFSTAKVSAKLFGAEAAKAGIMANLAMWQVTLIVAAITAIVAVVAALVTKESAAEKKAREAAETAEKFKEESEAAAQSLDKIKNAFDAYDTAVEKLNSCVEGTEEWKDALEEVNQTVLNILSDVPELAKEADLFTRNLDTGMLEINSKKRDEILQTAEKKATLAQATSLLSTAMASQANVELQKENVKEKIQGDTILDSILTDNAERLANLTEDEYRAEVETLIANELMNINAEYANVSDIIDDIADTAMDYQDSLNSLGNNTIAAANQMDTAMQIIADAVLGNDVGAAEKTIAAGEASVYQQKRVKHWTGKMKDLSWASGQNNATYKEIAQALSEATNGVYTAATGNVVKGGDGNRRLMFNKDGVAGEYDDDWIVQTIAAAEAIEKLGNSAETAGKTLSAMDTKIATAGYNKSAETVLRSFIANKNFDGHTKSDFANTYKDIAGADATVSKDDVTQYVTKIFGENGAFDDTMAQKYGFDTAQAMIDSFYSEITTMEKSWESVELPSNLLGTDNLKIETTQKLHNIFSDIDLGPNGAAAANTFVNGLNKMLTTLDPEEQTKALGQLSAIDWSDWDALEQADTIMQGFGVNIDTTSEEWVQFAASMRIAMRSQPDFSKLKQTLVDISAITSELDFGSIIDDDDYQKLMSYNDEWSKFFIMQADGSRKFIGDAKEMGKITQNNIRLQQQDLKLRKQYADAIKQSAGITGKANVNDVSTLIKNSKNNTDIQGALQKGGYDVSKIGSMTEAEFSAMAQYLTDFLNIDYNIETNDLNEMLASTANSMSELENLKAEIGNEAYEKQKIVLENAEAEARIAELYHEEDKILDSISNKLSTINALKENASGKEYIQILQEENKLLAQQMKIYVGNGNGGKIASLKTDKNNKEAELKEKYGVQFENGIISNYDELITKYAGNWDEVKKELDSYENTVEELSAAEQNIIDIHNQLQANAIEAFSAMDEELAKYNERMSHHNTLLEHSKNLLVLIGKETDYDAMGLILDGQAQVAKNKLDVSTSALSAYNETVADLEAKMKNSINNPEKFDMYKKQWEEATAAARAAEDQMLQDLTAWAEAEKIVLENTLANLGHTLEETLTGGMSFDQLATQMERAQSLQEEYLTTTNQIYETTKMMRTAQQAIDKSSNLIAKEKLKGFINETETLQKQGKLSKFELETQQAKYDLLVAEIALEEAKNAKSTVRLQRDSEGNLGYVYTADANAVSDAQQQFDDAQNALYNKGLEGANNYTQKYQQTLSEMADALSQIQTDYLNGQFASEDEYQAAMLETKNHYFEQLSTYSQLYGIATAADSNIAAEAWSTDFANMTTNTDKWSQAVDGYIKNASDAFEQWSSVVAEIEKTTGSDLASIEEKVSDITIANNNLETTLTKDGGIIDAMGTQLKSAQDIAKAYQSQGLALDTVLAKIKDIKTAVGISVSPILSNNDIASTGISSNADGGYTGSWGPSGKLSILHEEEMILTKNETKKFFDNLAIMESILSTIDTYAISQQLGGFLTSPNPADNNSNALEQNVKIEASFPGVTDKNEIEEAFNNLVNKASQYANRK